jgi:hypothetical protein
MIVKIKRLRTKRFVTAPQRTPGSSPEALILTTKVAVSWAFLRHPLEITLDNSKQNLLQWPNELRNTILPNTIALRWHPASVATSDATTSFALIQFFPCCIPLLSH